MVVFRESADTAEQVEIQELSEVVEVTGLADAGVDGGLSGHLLRAVEAYKASCAAAGETPTQEDAWLVLLSALQLDEAK
jgi:hypothetical protein